MARVTGIGGFFFPARDPEVLARWYTAHFGIDPIPGNYETQPWRQEAGETVFAPFKGEPHGQDPARSRWTLNLRVDDLDGIVAALRAAGVRWRSILRPIRTDDSRNSPTRRAIRWSSGNRARRWGLPDAGPASGVEWQENHPAR